MNENQFIVAARSRHEIEFIAGQLRRMFVAEDHIGICMLPVIELGLHQVWPDFVYEIVPNDEMSGAEATTDSVRRLIRISEQCYEEARIGSSKRAAFTLAHEVGHVALHTGRPSQFPRGGIVEPFRCSEWQANTFAGAFLMPEKMVRTCHTTEELAGRAGVTIPAAATRLKVVLGSKNKGRRPMDRAP